MLCFIQINDERKSMGAEYGKEEIYMKYGGVDNSLVRNKIQKGSKNWYIVDKINAKFASFLVVSKILIINPQLLKTHTKISS